MEPAPPAPPPPVTLIYLHSYNNLSLHVSMSLLLCTAPRQIILHRPLCHVQVQLLRPNFQIKLQTAGASSVMRITCTMVMMRSLKEGRLCHHTSRACNNARLVCELCIVSWCARPWIGKRSFRVDEYCIGRAAWDRVFEGGEVGDEEIIMIVCYH